MGCMFGFGRKKQEEPVPIVLYTRDGCTLCDKMKLEILRSGLAGRYAMREVDIAADPELTAMYGRSIPVLEIGGKVAFKGRMSAQDFIRKFERLAHDWHAQREHGTLD